MKSLDNKLIIYDNNCKVCSSMKDVVLMLTSIPKNKVDALGSLDENLLRKVDIDQFKNGMALIDIQNGKTLYGAEGVAYIFSSQYRIVNFLLSFWLPLQIFAFLYKTIAFNRYIIAAPKSKFNCECFPDKVIKFRISYIVITVTISVALTLLFGISLKGFFPMVTKPEAAIQMLLMAGSGWVIQIVLASLLLKDKAIDYIGHLGSIMVVGLLILVPWMLMSIIPALQLYWIPAISVAISSGTMLYLHIYRTKYLGISLWWTVSWFLFLQTTAAFWVYYFHIK